MKKTDSESSSSKNAYPGPNIIDNSKRNTKKYKIPYDMEININSILGFVNGWDIK